VALCPTAARAVRRPGPPGLRGCKLHTAGPPVRRINACYTVTPESRNSLHCLLVAAADPAGPSRRFLPELQVARKPSEAVQEGNRQTIVPARPGRRPWPYAGPASAPSAAASFTQRAGRSFALMRVTQIPLSHAMASAPSESAASY
jgi:hypothetical protein